MVKLAYKTTWGRTNVSFGLIYHFPDLHHIHENSAETLGPKYSIVNHLKIQTYDHSYGNIILWMKDEHF